MKRDVLLHTTCLLGASLWIVPSAAIAQSDDGEIVVTAQRRAESIMDVPLAMTALTGNALDERGIDEPTDLSSIVPNLQVNDSRSGMEPNFTMRGVGVGNDFSSSQASPVGLYADDAYLAFRALAGAHMFDLERVEVLRGPQGTLFGRNTTGGAVNFISRKPDLAGTDGYLTLGYGNFNSIKASGAAESTLIDGVMGVRVAVDYTRHDGYIENKAAGQPDLSNGDMLFARMSVRIKPTDTLDINIKGFANRARPWQPGAQSIGTASGTNPITGYSREGLGFWDVETESAIRNPVTTQGVSGTIKWDISPSITLQSLTAYDTGRSQFGQDTDESPYSVLQTDYVSRYGEFSQELRLSYTSDTFKFQGGGYYARDRVNIDNSLLILGLLEGFGLPADPTLTAGGATINQTYRQVRISKALFGQADLEVLPGLTVTAGLRYTWDTSRFLDGLTSMGDYDGTPLVYLIGSPEAPLNSRGSNKALTGRAAVSYEFQDGPMVYASYSRGYRAGRYNAGAYFDASQLGFVKPEYVDAYEVGAKGRFLDGALSLAVAGYWYEYTDQQLQDIVGTAIYLRNAGKSTIKGIEVEATGEITPEFILSASVGYSHGRFTQLTLEGIDLSGNQMPFAPDITANARADIGLGSLGSGTLKFSPAVTFTGSQWFTPYNEKNGNGLLRQGSYALFDASLGWKNDLWSVQLWGKNLAREKYFTYGSNLASFGFYYLTPGTPRTFGITASRQF